MHMHMCMHMHMHMCMCMCMCMCTWSLIKTYLNPYPPYLHLSRFNHLHHNSVHLRNPPRCNLTQSLGATISTAIRARDSLCHGAASAAPAAPAS